MDSDDLITFDRVPDNPRYFLFGEKIKFASATLTLIRQDVVINDLIVSAA